MWDRLFGTYEPEGERVVYGLTKNISTFNPLRITTHEWVGIGRDVFRARGWRDRASYLVRGPGWAGASDPAAAPLRLRSHRAAAPTAAAPPGSHQTGP